ncbi:MAG: SprT-like domain-containing protein [Candidatus Korobacteraceae bacterium]
MLNGKQLRIQFQQFNQQYFGGRLPPYRIRVVKHMTWSPGSGHCNKKRRLIEMKAGCSDEETLGTLLHEMAHAAASGIPHGMPWKKEMIRLREAGAPLATLDKFVKLDDWDGRTVTRRHFRAAIDDLLLDVDVSKVTLHGAVRYFLYNEGGRETVTSFLRRNPWVRAVIRTAKKQRAEDERLTH